MLNLLLRSDRYALKSEYRFRFINVVLVALMLGLVISAVSTFALHMFVWVEKGIADDQLESVKNSDNTKAKDELDSLNSDLRREFRVLSVDTPEYSGYINRLVSLQPDGVSINSFDFSTVTEEKDENVKIVVSGISSKRELLVNYVEALKGDSNFVSVDLPISSLTKDVNVNFSIDIKADGLSIDGNLEEN